MSVYKFISIVVILSIFGLQNVNAQLPIDEELVKKANEDTKQRYAIDVLYSNQVVDYFLHDFDQYKKYIKEYENNSF